MAASSRRRPAIHAERVPEGRGVLEGCEVLKGGEVREGCARQTAVAAELRGGGGAAAGRVRGGEAQ